MTNSIKIKDALDAVIEDLTMMRDLVHINGLAEQMIKFSIIGGIESSTSRLFDIKEAIIKGHDLDEDEED